MTSISNFAIKPQMPSPLIGWLTAGNNFPAVLPPSPPLLPASSLRHLHSMGSRRTSRSASDAGAQNSARAVIGACSRGGVCQKFGSPARILTHTHAHTDTTTRALYHPPPSSCVNAADGRTRAQRLQSAATTRCCRVAPEFRCSGKEVTGG